MYIALEGIKGAGKSTLLTLLSEALEQSGLAHATFKPTQAMPQYMWWEQAYPQWQHDDAYRSALYTARANYHAEQTNFEDQLIIGDRSILTSFVTRWDQQDDKAEFIRCIREREYAVPVPDVVWYLHVDLDIVKQRLTARQRSYGLHDETISRLAMAQQAYQQIFQNKADLGLKNMQIQYFDANEKVELILAKLLQSVKTVLKLENKTCDQKMVMGV